MGIVEVGVFGNDHPLLAERKVIDDLVGGAVLGGQLAGMESLVPGFFQERAQAGR